jgi:hypothetical protein
MAQAKAKSNSVVTTAWSPVGNRLQITVIGAGIVDFNAESASADNRAAAERHGWTQRLCDRAAMARDKTTGKPATAADKYNAIRELAEYYMSGDVAWKMSGGGGGDGGLLLTALCRLKADKTVAQVSAFLESRTKEQLVAVRARRDVIEEMNKVRLERAGDVDASDALDELDSMDAE